MRSFLHVVILLSLLALPSTSLAATISLSATSGSHRVGDEFTISVRLSSPDQAMNAASGIVHFPNDLLQVVSLSKASTIMSMWVQEPSYSNAAGTMNFEGVVLNPGFTGSNGNVLDIIFRAKKAGTASLSVSAGSVLANDGNGTEILNGASGTSVLINEGVEKTALPPPPVSSSPSGPVSTKLEAPIITNVTRSVEIGKVAEVAGTSVYPGATATLTLHVEANTLTSEATVAQNGVFSITQPYATPSGAYEGWVTIKKDNATSSPSEFFVITFVGKSLATQIVELVGTPEIVLSFAIIIAFLLGMFSVYFLFGDHKRNKNTREVLHDVDTDVHKAFLDLRNHINRSLENLEKESTDRELTTAEKHFVEDMTSIIKEAEKAIEKRVRGES